MVTSSRPGRLAAAVAAWALLTVWGVAGTAQASVPPPEPPLGPPPPSPVQLTAGSHFSIELPSMMLGAAIALLVVALVVLLVDLGSRRRRRLALRGRAHAHRGTAPG